MAKSKKPPLTAESAIAEIDAILLTLGGVTAPKLAPVRKLVGGKLYELYALCRLLSELVHRGWQPYFVGTTIELKGGPGIIQKSDPHVELRRRPGGTVEAEIHLDIEVGTLGANLQMVNDLSAFHEIDIVVVTPGVTGRPNSIDLKLGIECKATANFDKTFVREVLGRRRELSFYRPHSLPCLLDSSVSIQADPPSEYWLAFIDPAGMQYAQSPAVFGINFQHWQP